MPFRMPKESFFRQLQRIDDVGVTAATREKLKEAGQSIVVFSELVYFVQLVAHLSRTQ